MKLLIRPATRPATVLEACLRVRLPRADAAYPISIADLIAFARCPMRWVLGEPEELAAGYRLSDVIRAVVLGGVASKSYYIRRPETYQHKRLVCPTCKRSGEAGKCAACNRARLPETVDKPWAGAAKECKAWQARAEHAGLIPVLPAHWDRAQACLETVWQDPDAAEFLNGSIKRQLGEVTYVDPATREKIKVLDRIDIMPKEGSSLDCAVGMLWPLTDAALGAAALAAQVGYIHMHAAFMLAVSNLVTEVERREVLVLMVETNPPHLVARRRLAGELLSAGRELLLETLAALALCRAKKAWPTFDISAPGTLHGWTMVHRDPQIQDANEKTDARFAIQATRTLAAAPAAAQLGFPGHD